MTHDSGIGGTGARPSPSPALAGEGRGEGAWPFLSSAGHHGPSPKKHPTPPPQPCHCEARLGRGNPGVARKTCATAHEPGARHIANPILSSLRVQATYSIATLRQSGGHRGRRAANGGQNKLRQPAPRCGRRKRT